MTPSRTRVPPLAPHHVECSDEKLAGHAAPPALGQDADRPDVPHRRRALALRDGDPTNRPVFLPHEAAQDVTQTRRDRLKQPNHRPDPPNAADPVHELLLLVRLDPPLGVIGVLERSDEGIGHRSKILRHT
ncbi:MAG: hypothetical protein PHW86_02200 [Candidatus Bipolaricaulis sp.]|nr:hypothetical protein [Candidatus Bipolaricaulis sp.]